MSNMLMKLTAVCGAGVFAMCATAEAATYSFSAVSSNSPVSVQIGEDQISLQVSDPGAGLVRFTILNAGPLASSVANIYWEDSSGLMDSISAIIDSPPDVDFVIGGSPPDMPGDVGFDVDFRVGAAPPPSHKGVGPGQQVSIDFNLMHGAMFADVIAGLNNGGMRLGMHVIGFANGQSEWFVSDGGSTPPSVIIPAPHAAGLAGAGLLGLGAMRRRRSV